MCAVRMTFGDLWAWAWRPPSSSESHVLQQQLNAWDLLGGARRFEGSALRPLLAHVAAMLEKQLHTACVA
eukprot:CAMPEP_0174740394 /NCGR_PEP_ID=MMETSP1094-20130205/73470_1 /TAXON_ID=156173 /ORGANISM="Chrysochromulina brevifilum, Strain UTEX LB 985" /LENGTH=69 /DNA_ID=CAMNT_0015944089 /DNA_START=38 /DNA_END=245 /DNA_ORIENTATION=-